MWNRGQHRCGVAGRCRHSGQRGISLVELVLVIVILGVGMAGVLGAFMTATTASADPLIRKQMLSIAEQMLEEIGLQQYAATPATEAAAVSTCPARNAFNDVTDYHGYATTNGFCDISGVAVAGLASYNVSVTVDSGISLAAAGGSGAVASGNAARITVNVTHGGETLTLHGWRTHYANGL